MPWCSVHSPITMSLCLDRSPLTTTSPTAFLSERTRRSRALAHFAARRTLAISPPLIPTSVSQACSLPPSPAGRMTLTFSLTMTLTEEIAYCCRTATSISAMRTSVSAAASAAQLGRRLCAGGKPGPQRTHCAHWLSKPAVQPPRRTATSLGAGQRSLIRSNRVIRPRGSFGHPRASIGPFEALLPDKGLLRLERICLVFHGLPTDLDWPLFLPCFPPFSLGQS